VLGAIIDDGSKEDVVIWQDRQVVAVVRGDTSEVVRIRQGGDAS
jgi:hypothetical protein